MKELTITDLIQMKPNTIFSNGSVRHVHWVAVRGDIHDWAIYSCPNPWTLLGKTPYYLYLSSLHINESCRLYGQKLHDEKTIKRLIPCDDEALKMYRH